MGEEKRFFLFLIATTVVILVTPRLFRLITGPPPAVQQVAAPNKAQPADGAEAKHAPAADEPKAKDEAPPATDAQVKDEPKPDAEPKPEAEPEPEPELATRELGSTDASTGYTMKVHFTNRGAAVSRVELARYHAEDREGPLQLIAADAYDELSFLLGIKGLPQVLEQRNWRIVEPAEAAAPDSEQITFETSVPGEPLVVRKTYQLKKSSYAMDLAIEIANTGEKSKEVTYRLGGPRGLVLEGEWYSRKLRDVAIGDGIGKELKRHTVQPQKLYKGSRKVRELALATGSITKANWPMPPEWFDRFDRNEDGKLEGPEVDEAANKLAGGESDRWIERPVRFAGVEGQFFSAILIVPTPTTVDARWDAATAPILVERNSKFPERSDVSVEIESRAFELDPDSKLEHSYTIYAGPRKKTILQQTLQDPVLVEAVIDFHGVFLIFPAWLVALTASSMLFLLDLFHGWVGNWGVAIIMLTVLVRLLMFPLSRKQALSAVKMQALKPEMDALREKYKGDKEKLSRAQMELWRKHGVNPLGGCLPLVLQMPIFIGLWQGLSSSVDLRQANFFGWIDNLAAPDALFRFPWPETLWPLSYLGPYFNLLPAILMVLMLVQQKLFMPPKTNPPDPQMEMQQKLMTYMMVFFGFIFWQLPSGLCVYYIASTAWGIAERKLLPKLQTVEPIEPEKEKEPVSKKNRAAEARAAKRAGTQTNGSKLSNWLNDVIDRASKK